MVIPDFQDLAGTKQQKRETAAGNAFQDRRQRPGPELRKKLPACRLGLVPPSSE